MTEDYKRNVINYFKKNLSKGYTPETLKLALTNQGYSRSIIETALETAQKEMAFKAPLLKEKPVIKYQVIDENDNPIILKKSWWKKIFDKVFRKGY